MVIPSYLDLFGISNGQPKQSQAGWMCINHINRKSYIIVYHLLSSTHNTFAVLLEFVGHSEVSLAFAATSQSQT